MSEAGVYTIAFTVTNSQGLSASVSRTLVVEPVCPAGETLCSNKVSCLAQMWHTRMFTVTQAALSLAAPVVLANHVFLLHELCGYNGFALATADGACHAAVLCTSHCLLMLNYSCLPGMLLHALGPIDHFIQVQFSQTKLVGT